jgi:class 3 adenylate cyclase/tetratricopeptide (TPR) repeat protein
MSTESRNQEFSIEENDNHIQSKVIDEQSWSAILPYLPGVLVESIYHNPERNPPWIDPIVGSLLLADISGFTRMSEQLATVGKEGAEWLTDIINDYFHSMLDIATKNGGTNLKFGGDALLILFQGDNHAYRAVNAAIEMQRTTRKFAAYHAGRYRFHLNMTIGVHSGTFWSAVAGLPGQRMQHFILGEATSHLCEIESATSAGRLCISDATLSMLGELCITEPHGNIHRVLRLKRLHLTPYTVEYRLPPVLRTGELFAYLPPTVIESLKNGINLQYTIGEHRKVTIAFINLLEINEVLDERGPEVLLAEIQQYLSLIVRLTEQYGGFIASNDVYNVGLKLIVVFGAPVAHEHDSANALRFSLELNQEIARLNTRIHHRIGINSGFVFAGDVGPFYSRQYTVMGDAVNLAARLMSAASPDQTLLSGHVSSEAGYSFLTQQLPPIRVKGKVEPVPICLLQGEQTVEYYEAAKDFGTLFGREDEVESFKQICHQVENGKARTIVISGEAGIGKSRLFHEFQKYVYSLGWKIHTGDCHSYTIAKPYTPWIQILQSFFNISHTDTLEKRTEKVLSIIKSIIPDRQDEACLLNVLLDLNIPSSDVVRILDEESRRNRLFDLITSILQSVAKESPTLILMEDFHWVDRSSIQLTSRIATGMGSSPLLLCLIMRPTRETSLNLPQNSTITFNLTELPEQAALQIVNNVVNRPDLPKHITDIIIAKAKGNPLFLEEIATSLNQSGVIDQILEMPLSRVVEQIALLDIPDRVQSVIMARFDTITQVSKEIARIAAVIGSDFNFTVLHSFPELDFSSVTINTSLSELTHLGIISPEEDVLEPSFRFKHTLIREVIYDSLSFNRRRNLHHYYANYMEEANIEQLEPFYEALAYHYGQSRDNPKTRTYSIKSAKKAQQVFAHEEAIEYYRRCLDTIVEKSGQEFAQRSYLLERIGDCYEVSGFHEEAVRTFLSALRQWHSAARRKTTLSTIPSDLDDGIPFKVRETVLCHKIGVSYERNSDYDLSLNFLELAAQALPPRRPLEATRINITKSLALFRKGRYEEAIKWGRLGLTVSHRSGDQRNLAYAYNILANSYHEMGNFKKAIRCRLSAIRLYDELGDLLGQSDANNNLGACYQYLGNLDKALHHFEVSLNIDERIGNLVNAAIGHNNIGEVLLMKGNTEAAISHLQKVVQTYEQIGDPMAATGLALINLSRAYQCQQDYQIAYESLKRGERLLRKAGARGLLTEARLQRAELHLETGRTDSALRTCQQALNETRKLGMKLFEARGLRIMGCITMKLGRYTRAEDNLRESVDLASQLSADYEKGIALLCLARLYGNQGQEKKSRHQYQISLRKALAIFQRIGAQSQLSQALRFQNNL